MTAREIVLKDIAERLKRRIKVLAENSAVIAANAELGRQREFAQAELRKAKDAILAIRNKVHAHNRGGELQAGLRETIRDICDRALGTAAHPIEER